jgi:hypothetical protein
MLPWPRLSVLLLSLALAGCGWLVPDFGLSPPDLAAIEDLGDAGDLAAGELGEVGETLEDFVIPPQETWTGDLPVVPSWNCPVSLETLAPLPITGSFALEAQPSSVNLLSVYYSHCSETQSNPGPETAFLLAPSVPSRLELRLDCPPPCRAYLIREGCYFQNFQGCWNQDTGVWPSPVVSPGTWVLAVEQPIPEGQLAPPPFSIHGALTPLEPPADCPPDDLLRWSQLAPLGDDTVGTSLTLCLAPDAPDRVKTACAARSDTFGGMGELLLELVPDLPADPTAWLDLTITAQEPAFTFHASLGAADCSPEDFGCVSVGVGQPGPARFSTLAFADLPLRLRLEGDSAEVFPARQRCFDIEVTFRPNH